MSQSQSSIHYNLRNLRIQREKQIQDDYEIV